MRTQAMLPAGPGQTSTLGTRFLIYPQPPYVPGYDRPETVWISTDPSAVRAGPADARAYVRDPLFAKEPYEFPYLPPFAGFCHAPAEAGPDGHFDGIEPTSRQFPAAHAFAAVRRVIDIWESYLGRRIEWFFADSYERLEIIPNLDWNNAQSGFGFLELGTETGADGRPCPFALNFDVIAHEVGHAIQFSLFGFPAATARTSDFGALHEAGADLVSLLSFLCFDSGIDRLLRHCDGNLLLLNELNRIGELSGDRQIRLACNDRRLSDVTGEIHDRSRPYTGAVFDTVVDLFHTILATEGLVDGRLPRIDLRGVDPALLQRVSSVTRAAFRAKPLLFKSALIEARDRVAGTLAGAWSRLDPSDLTFADAAEAMVEAADRRDPLLAELFETNFRWREIA